MSASETDGTSGMAATDSKSKDPKKIKYKALHKKYPNFSISDLKIQKQRFDAIDLDGNGSLDLDELYQLMRRTHGQLTKDEVQKVMSQIDKDGNGTIDFEEFLQLSLEVMTDDKGSNAMAKVAKAAKFAENMVYELVCDIKIGDGPGGEMLSALGMTVTVRA